MSTFVGTDDRARDNKAIGWIFFKSCPWIVLLEAQTVHCRSWLKRRDPGRSFVSHHFCRRHFVSKATEQWVLTKSSSLSSFVVIFVISIVITIEVASWHCLCCYHYSNIVLCGCCWLLVFKEIHIFMCFVIFVSLQRNTYFYVLLKSLLLLAPHPTQRSIHSIPLIVIAPQCYICDVLFIFLHIFPRICKL